VKPKNVYANNAFALPEIVENESYKAQPVGTETVVKMLNNSFNTKRTQKRPRIFSSSDSRQSDLSESYVAESVSSLSRMNSVTKKYFRGGTTSPERLSTFVRHEGGQTEVDRTEGEYHLFKLHKVPSKTPDKKRTASIHVNLPKALNKLREKYRKEHLTQK